MSKNYAITRVKKHRHLSQLVYLLNHHLRSVMVPNADPTKAHKNEILLQRDVQDFLEEVPKGSKKNACRFVDCIFAASRFDTPEQAKQWEKSTFEFIKKEFGEENLALVVVHNDETTKHIHVIFKPVNPNTKKLGAGHWFDGRMKMKAYQERYFQSVKDLGFDRGDPAKRAHHTTIKEFYAQVNKSAEQAQADADYFKKLLHQLHRDLKNISIWDAFKPGNFYEKMKPKFGKAYKKGKEVFAYKAYSQVEKIEEENHQLAQELQNLRDKLEALTGSPNPSWVDVQKHSEVLTAEAEKSRAAALPVKGVAVEIKEGLQAQPETPTANKKRKIQ